MIRRLFPRGKGKAFNISYDDGVTQDIRFVELLNRYGLKGTFNLNSQLMESGFEWVHHCGMTVRRLTPQQAAELYSGHEVASHTLTHPYMDELSRQEILHQMVTDKDNLEQIFQREIRGFAVPFEYYSDLIARCAREAGFEYARVSEESNSYEVPGDYYWWMGGKFHWDADLEEYVDGFLQTDSELALCQIVGHSYNLDTENMWGRMEAIFAKISRDEDVLPMTNLEIVRYMRAMEMADISDEKIVNHSKAELWFRVDGETVALRPGCTLSLGQG